MWTQISVIADPVGRSDFDGGENVQVLFNPSGSTIAAQAYEPLQVSQANAELMAGYDLQMSLVEQVAANSANEVVGVPLQIQTHGLDRTAYATEYVSGIGESFTGFEQGSITFESANRMLLFDDYVAANPLLSWFGGANPRSEDSGAVRIEPNFGVRVALRVTLAYFPYTDYDIILDSRGGDYLLVDMDANIENASSQITGQVSRLDSNTDDPQIISVGRSQGHDNQGNIFVSLRHTSLVPYYAEVESPEDEPEIDPVAACNARDGWHWDAAQDACVVDKIVKPNNVDPSQITADDVVDYWAKWKTEDVDFALWGTIGIFVFLGVFVWAMRRRSLE